MPRFFTRSMPSSMRSTGSGSSRSVFIDDTDQMAAGRRHRSRSPGCRILRHDRADAGRAGVASLMAMPETYLDMPAYREGARGFLTDMIRVPRLGEAHLAPDRRPARVDSDRRVSGGGDAVDEPRSRAALPLLQRRVAPRLRLTCKRSISPSRARLQRSGDDRSGSRRRRRRRFSNAPNCYKG